MARIIEAKAVISAEDRASATLAAMAKRVSEMSKAQAAYNKAGGAQTAKMAADMSKLDKKMVEMAGFRKLSANVQLVGEHFRRAQADAARLKTAMQAAGTAGGTFAKDYERAVRAMDLAKRAYRDQIMATRDARQAIEATGMSVSQLSNKQGHLRRQIEASTAALKQQTQATGSQVQAAKRLNAMPWGAPPTSKSGVPLIPRAGALPLPAVPPHPGLLRPSAALPAPAVKPTGQSVPVAEVGAGLGLYQALKGTATAGMDVDTERSQARQSGWSEADIVRAEKRANDLGARYGMAPGAAFNMLREARPTFGGDLDTTMANVEPFFGVATAMRQKSPNAGSGEINKAVNDMIKAGEILGYSNDPQQLLRYADLMTRMSQVFGTQLRGEEVLNFAKRSKTAGSDVSFEFLQDVMPTLLPELGGDATGVALMTLRQALVGGKMKKRAAENMANLGLIAPENMIKTLDEDVVGVQPNAVKGADILRRNPKKWVEQFLTPAMDAKNVAPDDRAAIISTLFSDRNAEHMVNLLVTQAARMRKDKDLVDQALGIKGVDQALKDDPYLATKRVGGAAANVGSAISDPFLDPLKAGADAAANALNSLAETARGNPGGAGTGVVAGGVGGALLGLLGSAGSGLWWRGAAAALGGAGGGLAGGIALPWMIKSFADAVGPRGPEGSKSFHGSAMPGFAGEIEKSLKAQKEGRRDPEAFRGRAMMNAGNGIDLSALREIEAVVKAPIDVTGKLDPVELKGQATVSITVKAQEGSQVVGMSTSSSGHVKAEGTALVGRFGRN